MENLQKLEPYFQELLQTWYQLTLDNKAYAIFLVVCTCLVMAIFYSIRIGFLKRNQAKTLSAKNEIQASLDETNEQLHTLQQQYDETNELKQQAEQNAEAEMQQLQASNKQLAGSLSRMVECFELNQPNLPSADAENLHTDYETVLEKVCERFQNEQQAKTQLQLSLHSESSKLAEKEMLATSLQNRLDSQALQLSKLESAVEQFENAQQQLEADKEQLEKEMAMRHAEAVRELELEKQQLAEAHQQATEAVTDSSPGADVPPEPVIEPENIDPVSVEPVVKEQPAEKEEPAETLPEPETDAQVSEEPEIITAPQPDSKARADGGKKKGLFGRTIDKFIKMDEKLSGSGGNKQISEQPLGIEQTPEELAKPEVKTEAQTPDETGPQKPESEKSLNEKLTGLLGGFKKSSEKQAKAEKIEPTPSTPGEQEVHPDQEKPTVKTNKMASRLTGLLGKLKSKK